MAALGRILSVVVGTALYLGLAIAGLGGFRSVSRTPGSDRPGGRARCGVGRSALCRRQLSPGEREDRSNRWVIVAFTVIGLLIGVLPAYTDRKEFWTLDGETIRWVGVVLFAAGTALRIWPVFVLGNRFSGLVAIQPGHQLVTTGVYGVIRNPSYLGLLVGTLGWALAFRSIVGILLAAMLIPPLVARMRAEEGLLHSHFGGEYDAYRARTWRLIPGLY